MLETKTNAFSVVRLNPNESVYVRTITTESLLPLIKREKIAGSKRKVADKVGWVMEKLLAENFLKSETRRLTIKPTNIKGT